MNDLYVYFFNSQLDCKSQSQERRLFELLGLNQIFVGYKIGIRPDFTIYTLEHHT